MSIPASTPTWSGSLMPTLMLSEVIENTLDIVACFFQTRLAVVSKIEGTAYTVIAAVDQQRMLRPGVSYQLQHTFCRHMLASGKPLQIDDVMAAPAPLNDLPRSLRLDICAYLGVPLRMLDGRIFGTLWVADSAPYHFSGQDIAMLQLLARLLNYELDRDAQMRHTERMQQMAEVQIDIDPLTGLIGYDSFEVVLAQEIAHPPRTPSIHAIAVLSLNPHTSAAVQPARHSDMLRQGLANLLMRTTRIVDCCSRTGANEFAVMLPSTTPDEVAAWRHRIEAEIDAWNDIHAASNVSLNIHIGLASTNEIPGPKLDGQTLLELARQRSRQVEAS